MRGTSSVYECRPESRTQRERSTLISIMSLHTSLKCTEWLTHIGGRLTQTVGTWRTWLCYLDWGLFTLELSLWVFFVVGFYILDVHPRRIGKATNVESIFTESIKTASWRIKYVLDLNIYFNDWMEFNEGYITHNFQRMTKQTTT